MPEKFREINKGYKSFGFGLRSLKKNYELIPIVGIMGLFTVGLTGFTLYSLFYKTDVVINKNAPPRFEEINPEQPQKFYTIAQEYKRIPELERAKREVAELRSS